jgi:hypothetical protein
MEIDMKTFGTVASFAGLLILASIVGSFDYYDECRAAVDCVAGEEPSILWALVKGIVALILMFVGVSAIISSEE